MGNINYWHSFRAISFRNTCYKLSTILKKEWLEVKWSALRTLVEIRAWMYTDKGEKTLVKTLTIISVVFIIDLVILIVGHT